MFLLLVTVLIVQCAPGAIVHGSILHEGRDKGRRGDTPRLLEDALDSWMPGENGQGASFEILETCCC